MKNFKTRHWICNCEEMWVISYHFSRCSKCNKECDAGRKFVRPKKYLVFNPEYIYLIDFIQGRKRGNKVIHRSHLLV